MKEIRKEARKMGKFSGLRHIIKYSAIWLIKKDLASKNMKNNKKIGVFDSGLGGLFIARAIRERLPLYDYVFLGDTLHLPYGSRSDEAIYNLSEKAMRYLFAQGCDLVVMACNTASVTSLRRLQQKFLVEEFPDNRILGVVVPTLETAIEHGAHRIGLLATQRTVNSEVYDLELKKINPFVQLHAVGAPLLVPLIENRGEKYLDMVLEDYLKPLIEADVQSLILGCTHYVALKERIARLTDGEIDIISQDDIIPPKFAYYLARHADMESELSRGGTFAIHATDANDIFADNIAEIMGERYDVISANY